jgi:hypothetical protein
VQLIAFTVDTKGVKIPHYTELPELFGLNKSLVELDVDLIGSGTEIQLILFYITLTLSYLAEYRDGAKVK